MLRLTARLRLNKWNQMFECIKYIIVQVGGWTGGGDQKRGEDREVVVVECGHRGGNGRAHGDSWSWGGGTGGEKKKVRIWLLNAPSSKLCTLTCFQSHLLFLTEEMENGMDSPPSPAGNRFLWQEPPQNISKYLYMCFKIPILLGSIPPLLQIYMFEESTNE